MLKVAGDLRRPPAKFENPAGESSFKKNCQLLVNHNKSSFQNYLHPDEHTIQTVLSLLPRSLFPIENGELSFQW